MQAIILARKYIDQFFIQTKLYFEIHYRPTRSNQKVSNLHAATVSFFKTNITPPIVQPSGVIKWVYWPICTHTNPRGRLRWPYAITRLTAHFVCGLIWWFASLEKYGHTWHRMSLQRPGVIKPHKPKPKPIVQTKLHFVNMQPILARTLKK